MPTGLLQELVLRHVKKSHIFCKSKPFLFPCCFLTESAKCVVMVLTKWLVFDMVFVL